MAERMVFDGALYPAEAVEATAAAFAEHAQVELVRTAAGIEARIEVTGGDARVMAHHFGNYALQESIARRRQRTAEGSPA